MRIGDAFSSLRWLKAPKQPERGFLGRHVRRELKNLNVKPGLNGTVIACNRLPDKQLAGLFELLEKVGSEVQVPFGLRLPDVDIVLGNEKRGLPSIDFDNLARNHVNALFNEGYFNWHTLTLDLKLLPAYLAEVRSSENLALDENS